VEVLLDGDEIARRMKCTRRHLELLNAESDDAPPSVKIGRLRRYPESLFNEWIQKKIQEMKEAATQLESPQPAVLEADPQVAAHIEHDALLTARQRRPPKVSQAVNTAQSTTTASLPASPAARRNARNQNRARGDY